MSQLVNGLKAWQIGVLAAVLIVGAGIAYGAYVFVIDGPDDTGLSGGEQLIPVSRGDLVNEVSVSGGLTFPNRETLRFGTAGTVSRVLVEEGESVAAGQPLAALDEETVATLDKAIAQSQVSVRDAEDALADALSPAANLELAQAEARLADARVAHQTSLDALADLLQPSAQQLADAEAAAANARVSLAAAEESLAAVLEVDEEAVARAESAAVTARITLEDAKDALAETLNGPTDDVAAKAQLEVDSASTTLANARRDLKITVSEWNDKIESAEETLATAVEDYSEAFLKWLGIYLDGTQQHTDPDTLLDSFGIDLELLFDPASRFYDVGQWTSTRGLARDNPDTVWSETTIYSWLNLYPGAIYPTCSDGIAPAEGACVRQELDDGWEPVRQGLDSLEAARTSEAKAVAKAEIDIANAGDGLSTAAQALADLKEAPNPLRTESLEKDIVVAQAALDTAVEELASLTGSPDEVDVEAKRARAVLAKADLDAAEQGLLELTGDPDPIAMEAAEKQFGVAVEQLRAAEEDLAELREGPDPLIAALRKTELAAAQAALDASLQMLEAASITAPWDGVVTAVDVEVGDDVSSNTQAMEIVDPTVVEVDGAIDEMDVLFLREGATASITMDALPGQTLAGSVSNIAAQSTNQQGVVTYPISIRVETNGLQLPEGLTAVASVVLREDRDVLLVPLDALYGSFDTPLVRVSSNGRIEERPVELGNTDDFWAVVTSGVSEAELVVMQSEQAQTSFGFGGFARGFGGGFRGGPGGPR